MWTCPNCKKKFKNINQWHSCAIIEKDEHFNNKPPVLKAAFEKLMKKVSSFGEVTLNPVKSVIQVKAGSTFLSVKPKKDFMEIEFFLGYESNSDLITKTFVFSKNRTLHFAIIRNPADISAELINLIHKSYRLIRGE